MIDLFQGMGPDLVSPPTNLAVIAPNSVEMERRYCGLSSAAGAPMCSRPSKRSNGADGRPARRRKIIRRRSYESGNKNHD